MWWPLVLPKQISNVWEIFHCQYARLIIIHDSCHPYGGHVENLMTKWLVGSKQYKLHCIEWQSLSWDPAIQIAFYGVAIFTFYRVTISIMGSLDMKSLDMGPRPNNTFFHVMLHKLTNFMGSTIVESHDRNCNDDNVRLLAPLILDMASPIMYLCACTTSLKLWEASCHLSETSGAWCIHL